MTGAIGIDIAVAKPVTIAWKEQGIWLVRHVEPEDYDMLLSTMELLYCLCYDAATHAAIEQPYVGPNKRGALELARVYGRIEVLCEQAGLVVIPAPPSTWQAEMLTPRGGRLGDRKNRKRLSILVAKGLGADVTDENGKDSDDKADAVCIATWGTEQARLMALERGEG